MLKNSVKLVLEDGSEYLGKSFGAEISSAGEVVFNTGMIGYPETLTDPSYKDQILVLTYPIIGNYGIPKDEIKNNISQIFESEKIQIAGLIVSYYCENYSHWQAVKSLGVWLKENNIPAIFGIDTRSLTQKLRDKGTMLGKIINPNSKVEVSNFYDPNKINIVDKVSIKENITYNEGHKKVYLIDCGTKNNIIRSLIERNITVVRVPWNYNFDIKDADGVLISNGPGDPSMCTETIEITKKLLKSNKPILGICLGSQIMALASGSKTYKLKYGHRSLNQPCIEISTGRCYITSQNHGFAIDQKTLPKDWEIWFANNNDRTVEGIRHLSKPHFAVQFHPEASPGPDDSEFIFDYFIKKVNEI